MDHTPLMKRIEDLEQAGASEAVELADELAELLALILDPDPEDSG